MARLADAIAPAAEELARQVAATGVSAEQFWSHLIALAAEIDGNRELAETAVRKTLHSGVVPDAPIAALVGSISDAEAAFHAATPNLLDQLELRSGPLIEQWNARGPGIFTRLTAITERTLAVESADVVLVYPALGGCGVAHLPYNSVRIEAVLANPVAEIPEVVRLAWLIAQLNIDLPRFSERINHDQLLPVAALAMIPPVLLAAEYVELCEYDTATIQLALDHWNMNSCTTDNTAQILMDWWATYADSRPDWHIALEALAEMVGGVGTSGV
jgi:hypothetical protein